jgi:hypothetical protein
VANAPPRFVSGRVTIMSGIHGIAQVTIALLPRYWYFNAPIILSKI